MLLDLTNLTKQSKISIQDFINLYIKRQVRLSFFFEKNLRKLKIKTIIFTNTLVVGDIERLYMKEKAIKKDKVGIRNWVLFIIIGFAGQLAWSLENMYLNTFIFDLGATNYNEMITWTTALSAITACLTTIIMGGLSDKLGRRKVFICGGYLLWGVSTAAFGFITESSVQSILPFLAAAQTASIFVIILDCIMTFFGSTANDAAFNSYVTRNVKSSNRGKVEGVLAILPLMSMLVITVLYGQTAEKGNWNTFFYIIGGFVFVCGLIALFLVPKEKIEKINEPYYKFLLEGFKIKTIKNNPLLYILLIADFVYCGASQIFFPYMVIYFGKTLGFEGTNFLILLGTVLLVGSLLAVIAGFLLDKVNKSIMLIPLAIVYIFGLVLLFFVTKGDLVFAIIAGVMMMFGYIILATTMNAMIREFTPSGKEGVFQGIRMIFQVALPMITGPYIGQIIVEGLSNETFTNDFGNLQKLPPNWIWLIGAGVMLLIFIPVIILIIKEKKMHKLDNEGLLYEQDKED